METVKTTIYVWWMGPILWKVELRFVRTMPGEPSALRVSARTMSKSFAGKLGGFLLEVSQSE